MELFSLQCNTIKDSTFKSEFLIQISFLWLMFGLSWATTGAKILEVNRGQHFQVDMDINEVPVGLSVDWAYSPMDLERLASLEDELYKELNNTETNGSSSPADDISWWMQDYSQSTLVSANSRTVDLKEVRLISSHPFLALRMLKRFRRLAEILNGENGLHSSSPGFYRKVLKFNRRLKLPSAVDVENVMKNILEIQFVYDLNVEELIRGNFSSVWTDFGLKLEEAFEIGSLAFRLKMYPEALDWLESIYFQSNEAKKRSGLFDAHILSLVTAVSKEHDELIETVNNDNYYDHYHRFTDKIASEQRLVPLKEADRLRFQEEMKTGTFPVFPAYLELCAGKDFRTKRERSQLFCWYESKSDLAWLINPLKMEAHSLDPAVVQIYEVLGEKVIEALRRPDILRMERTATYKYAEDGSIESSEYTNHRTSSSATLNDTIEGNNILLQPLDSKIGRMTQLTVSNFGEPKGSFASEPIQISSYAFGGQVKPHLDTVGGNGVEVLSTTGDRVATFMIYLNDVELGGYTVFPLLGISVVPKRGSAVFWYNLRWNGEADIRSFHAACPVILGQKWIATKWIRSSANFLKRKCSMKSSE